MEEGTDSTTPEGVTPLSLRGLQGLGFHVHSVIAGSRPDQSTADPSQQRDHEMSPGRLGGRAAVELANWPPAKVAAWLDDSFGDPELARLALEARVDGEQGVYPVSRGFELTGSPY